MAIDTSPAALEALAAIIDDAPHAEYCGAPSSSGAEVYSCRCWKEKAAAVLSALERERKGREAAEARAAENAKDAERWRKHEEIVRMSALDNSLRIRLTLRLSKDGPAWEIESVLPIAELVGNLLGIKPIGLAAEDQARKLFAAIDAAREKP